MLFENNFHLVVATTEIIISFDYIDGVPERDSSEFIKKIGGYMKTKLKRSFLVLMVLVLGLALLSSCAKNEKSDSESKQITASDEKSNPDGKKETDSVAKDDDKGKEEEKLGYRLVTDQVGREVKVPLDPKRVVITFWPMGSAYTLFQGSAETIVGMDPNMVNVAKHSLLMKIDPRVAEIDSSFMNNESVINEEALIALKPDLALIPAYATDQLEIFEKLEIPTIVFTVTTADFNNVETYMSWVDLLGEALGKQGKATQIREYGRQVLDEIAAKTKDLKEEEKPSALLLINYNESAKSTSGKNQFARFLLETTGARHVAADVEETFIQLDMEQIYKWNPDIIYITTFSEIMPDDLYNNTAVEGDDWSVVKAVQNKNVHKFPLGIFHWYPPSADSPLALLWLAKTNHPNLFADVDLHQRVKDYYKDLYQIELSDEEVDSIFASTDKAANQ